MLHNKYQGPVPCGFSDKIFSCFPYVKNVTPGRPIFGPSGILLKKLDSGPLSDAAYQISVL